MPLNIERHEVGGQVRQQWRAHLCNDGLVALLVTLLEGAEQPQLTLVVLHLAPCPA